MFEELGAIEWLVVLSAGALGFGLIRFFLVTITNRTGNNSVPLAPFETHPATAHEVATAGIPGRFTDAQHRPWYEVLGVEPQASAAEIQQAYDRKRQDYALDKFQPLGDAFVRLAEKSLGETESAYAQALSAR